MDPVSKYLLHRPSGLFNSIEIRISSLDEIFTPPACDNERLDM